MKINKVAHQISLYSLTSKHSKITFNSLFLWDRERWQYLFIPSRNNFWSPHICQALRILHWIRHGKKNAFSPKLAIMEISHDNKWVWIQPNPLDPQRVKRTPGKHTDVPNNWWHWITFVSSNNTSFKCIFNLLCADCAQDTTGCCKNIHP